MVRVFAIDLGDQGSIPGRVVPKVVETLEKKKKKKKKKKKNDASLLNTQHYEVQIKQLRKMCSALPNTSL